MPHFGGAAVVCDGSGTTSNDGGAPFPDRCGPGAGRAGRPPARTASSRSPWCTGPCSEDWSFPKGKLEEGETFEMAALREVQEETGMTCRLLRFIGHTEYVDRKGRPKAWPTGSWRSSGVLRPNEEVDELRWLSLDEAARLLSYERDRELLAVLGAADQVEPLI
jgi:8-oxo-dGTP diphosphatase